MLEVDVEGGWEEDEDEVEEEEEVEAWEAWDEGGWEGNEGKGGSEGRRFTCEDEIRLLNPEAGSGGRPPLCKILLLVLGGIFSMIARKSWVNSVKVESVTFGSM